MTQIQWLECCQNSAPNIIILNSNICRVLTMSLHFFFFYNNLMKSELKSLPLDRGGSQEKLGHVANVTELVRERGWMWSLCPGAQSFLLPWCRPPSSVPQFHEPPVSHLPSINPGRDRTFLWPESSLSSKGLWLSSLGQVPGQGQPQWLCHNQVDTMGEGGGL